ncbi:hypothetical protein TIFTF001_006908 [Ficus carica]|uniref:Uncharacterized protein n=1 Tax=Ficus carica TaxID=3494 RepID=A0AA87ZI96_FICCA|nr:hypothetical protein TIFTF001_006908 [Ficus carica]
MQEKEREERREEEGKGQQRKETEGLRGGDWVTPDISAFTVLPLCLVASWAGLGDGPILAQV